MKAPRLLETKEGYTTDYPTAIAYAEAQDDIMWTAKEVDVDKDIHDLKTNLTEAELHGVTTVLKLFTLYELHVGNDYWLDYVRKKFQRPEVQRMAATFGKVELGVHAPFYDKLNELMGLKTDEFYASYKQDPTLNSRMNWIDKQFSIDDPLLVTAMGSITEGAILYSNFAFLKHFQAEGKNKLTHMTSGINFSVRDENLHSEAGAWIYKQLVKEEQPDKERMTKLVKKIKAASRQILEHESRIIDMIFEKGKIRGITDVQMKNFIKARLNLCLQQLDIDPIFDVGYDPISGWFYHNINAGQLHDFFSKQGNNYSRDWKETSFSWT